MYLPVITIVWATNHSGRYIAFDKTLQWRHNEHDGVSNHQPQNCLLNRLSRHRSKKTSKLHVTGFCGGNSSVTGEFRAQRAGNAENVSIWWRHKAIKRTGAIYPKIMFYIFDALLRPIVTYESDILGFNRKSLTHLDKIFLHYARCVLKVKSTTCNTIVYGECGQFPPSVHCQINMLCLWNRLANTSANKIVKQV